MVSVIGLKFYVQGLFKIRHGGIVSLFAQPQTINNMKLP